jgi:two-component system, cell cycle sensor histidine kinase and response regulator CckA
MPTILVVDDEPGIRMFVSQILEQNGFSVLTAPDGADAISISQSHQGEIGLVITDVRMPNVDGLTLAQALLEEDPNMPVLFMSSHYDASLMDQFEGSEFLAKPFSVDRLLEAVRTMLGELSLQLVN